MQFCEIRYSRIIAPFVDIPMFYIKFLTMQMHAGAVWVVRLYGDNLRGLSSRTDAQTIQKLTPVYILHQSELPRLIP